MPPAWLSNAYVIGDQEGGTAVFAASGAPLEPLFQAVDRHGLTVTHLLTTHADHDHVAGDDQIRSRFDCPVVKGNLETGGPPPRAPPPPPPQGGPLPLLAHRRGPRAPGPAV